LFSLFGWVHIFCPNLCCQVHQVPKSKTEKPSLGEKKKFFDDFKIKDRAQKTTFPTNVPFPQQ
jgi:hypothetical protein